ncbi:hypothetical protein BBJ28_00007395 [Nothophytophthora sp. Chile5]|nr:hypothetical protein BBJ28_00007395 [Nothophytophthora sp. Chile5]
MERSQKTQYRGQTARLGLAVMALAVASSMADEGSQTRMEAKQVAGSNLLVQVVAEDGEEAGEKPRGGRRLLLKHRSKHKAKLEEVDQMKVHLDEYKQRRKAIDSLRTRFDMYASKSVTTEGDKRVKAMTFTDFLHSFVLPQFHLQSPHFDVAFCMFDLDGDGSVGKTEFCAVIENLLRAITLHEGGKEAATSAEETLPRLIKFLFGRFGKTITAKDLDAALDVLRKQILRAEFDLYATAHPTLKSQEAISVHDFALTLISCFDPEKLPPYLDRVQALNASDGLVTWDEFFAFHFNVQSNLPDIKLAFELTGAAEITEGSVHSEKSAASGYGGWVNACCSAPGVYLAEFIRAARVVSGVELSSPVVQLAFRIFDDNGRQRRFLCCSWDKC